MPGNDPVRRKGKDKAIERVKRNGKYSTRSVRMKEAKANASLEKRATEPDPPLPAQKNQ